MEIGDCLPLRGRWLAYFRRSACWALGTFLAWGWCFGLPGLLRVSCPGATGRGKLQIQALREALEQYTEDNGQAPTTTQGLQALITRPTQGPLPAQWRGPYLEGRSVAPADPWGKPLVYLSPGPLGERYRIVSFGADGYPGGSGDAADLIGLAPEGSPFWRTFRRKVLGRP